METFDREIIGKVHETLKRRGLRLSVAESCTGGLVAHMLTSLPGASAFFEGSIICYSANSKIKILGIRKSHIEKHGTVSEETAREMAEAVMRKTGADVSLAVTGSLGPEPIEGKRAGLIFIAAAVRGAAVTSRGFIFEGAREEIRFSASNEALHFLYEAVSAWG